MEPAARIAFETILKELDRLSSVKHIRFVLFDEADRDLHDRILRQVAGSDG